YFAPHIVQRTDWLENAFRFPFRSGRKWWTTMRATTSFGSTARIRSARSSCLSIFSAMDPSPQAGGEGPLAPPCGSLGVGDPLYWNTLPVRLPTWVVRSSALLGLGDRLPAAEHPSGY